MQCFRPTRASDLQGISPEELRKYVTRAAEENGTQLDVDQCIRKCRHWIREQELITVPPDLNTSVSIPPSSSSHPQNESPVVATSPRGTSPRSLEYRRGATESSAHHVLHSKLKSTGGVGFGRSAKKSALQPLSQPTLETSPLDEKPIVTMKSQVSKRPQVSVQLQPQSLPQSLHKHQPGAQPPPQPQVQPQVQQEHASSSTVAPPTATNVPLYIAHPRHPSSGTGKTLSPPRLPMEATAETLTTDTDHAATKNFEDTTESEESIMEVPNMGRWGNRHDLRLKVPGTPAAEGADPDPGNLSLSPSPPEETASPRPSAAAATAAPATPGSPPQSARSAQAGVSVAPSYAPAIHIGSSSIRLKSQGPRGDGDAASLPHSAGMHGPHTSPTPIHRRDSAMQAAMERGVRSAVVDASTPLATSGHSGQHDVSVGTDLTIDHEATHVRDACTSPADTQTQESSGTKDSTLQVDSKHTQSSTSLGTAAGASKVDCSTQVVAKKKTGRNRKPVMVDCSTQVVTVRKKDRERQAASHRTSSNHMRFRHASKEAIAAVEAYHRRTHSSATAAQSYLTEGATPTTAYAESSVAGAGAAGASPHCGGGDNCEDTADSDWPKLPEKDGEGGRERQPRLRPSTSGHRVSGHKHADAVSVHAQGGGNVRVTPGGVVVVGLRNVAPATGTEVGATGSAAVQSDSKPPEEQPVHIAVSESAPEATVYVSVKSKTQAEAPRQNGGHSAAHAAWKPFANASSGVASSTTKREAHTSSNGMSAQTGARRTVSAATSSQTHSTPAPPPSKNPPGTPPRPRKDATSSAHAHVAAVAASPSASSVTHSTRRSQAAVAAVASASAASSPTLPPPPQRSSTPGKSAAHAPGGPSSHPGLGATSNASQYGGPYTLPESVPESQARDTTPKRDSLSPPGVAPQAPCCSPPGSHSESVPGASATLPLATEAKPHRGGARHPDPASQPPASEEVQSGYVFGAQPALEEVSSPSLCLPLPAKLALRSPMHAQLRSSGDHAPGSRTARESSGRDSRSQHGATSTTSSTRPRHHSASPRPSSATVATGRSTVGHQGNGNVATHVAAYESMSQKAHSPQPSLPSPRDHAPQQQHSHQQQAAEVSHAHMDLESLTPKRGSTHSPHAFASSPAEKAAMLSSSHQHVGISNLSHPIASAGSHVLAVMSDACMSAGIAASGHAHVTPEAAARHGGRNVATRRGVIADSAVQALQEGAMGGRVVTGASPKRGGPRVSVNSLQQVGVSPHAPSVEAPLRKGAPLRHFYRTGPPPSSPSMLGGTPVAANGPKSDGALPARTASKKEAIRPPRVNSATAAHSGLGAVGHSASQQPDRESREIAPQKGHSSTHHAEIHPQRECLSHGTRATHGTRTVRSLQNRHKSGTAESGASAAAPSKPSAHGHLQGQASGKLREGSHGRTGAAAVVAHVAEQSRADAERAACTHAGKPSRTVEAQAANTTAHAAATCDGTKPQRRRGTAGGVARSGQRGVRPDEGQAETTEEDVYDRGIEEWMLWTLGMENGDTVGGPLPTSFENKRKVSQWLRHQHS